MKLETLLKIVQEAAASKPLAEVRLYWDYAPRGEVEGVYFNKDGEFVLAGESNYDTGDNPDKIIYENHD
jgi:hypothetical protein